MRLTVFTDYSLRVLLVLTASRDRLVTIAEVSKSFDISETHLMKVANTLSHKGWVKTIRGRGGGMRLDIDPTQLTLRTVVEQLEGDSALVECFGEHDRCKLTGGCGLESALWNAREAFYQALEAHTLADIAARSPRLRRVI